MEITNKLILHCIIIGIFTIFIGLVVEIMLRSKKRECNFLTKLKKRNISLLILVLFIFGFFIHYLFEYSGFEAYCEKKCIDGKCDYVCNIKMNA